MKVVINSSFGGYSLSVETLVKYCQLKAIPCYLFQEEYDNESWRIKRTPISLDEIPKDGSLSIAAYSVSNPDDHISDFTNEEWNMMSTEERASYNAKARSIEIKYSHINRDDPLLIEAIEQVGIEHAGGNFSELKIVEIPDDVEWYIDEYDGIEVIRENHRKWS